MSELSRAVVVAQIGASGLGVVVEAGEAERAAVAARMDIPAIRSLKCVFSLTRDEDDGTIIIGTGHLHARVTRVCVVSAEDFETDVEDHFEVRFVPAGQENDELDPDRDDEIPYENGQLDVGEAAVEQLGLVLDPYPKMEGATLPGTEDGGASPFAALKRLGKAH